MMDATPFYFGGRSRPLFGWLHRPRSRTASDVGLVICNPLGYEAVSCHRTNRHLAIAAAQRGIPALRFDYDGTGDSAGTDTDPGRFDAWLDSIRFAIEALQVHAGVRSVFLCGIRLGGTLALISASANPRVAGVIAISPVIQGRRYLRELRALSATSSAVGGSEAAALDEPQAAAGFITTAETRDSLSLLNLAGDTLSGAAEQVLLLERADLPADDSLPQRLAELGAKVTRIAFPGYADMMRDPHESEVPLEAIQQIVTWIPLPDAGNAASPESGRSDELRCHFSWTDGKAPRAIQERIALLGTSPDIFGIVTESDDPGVQDSASRRRTALLLLNSGAVHHIGPNRLYVNIARHFAQRGITVLRLDLPGLGDSTIEKPEDENTVYPPWATDAISRAVDFARSELHAEHVVCAGICSGGYHSLKAAVAGLRLDSVIVINPLTFFWKPDLPLSAPVYQDTSEMMRYRASGMRLRTWLKLLKGDVDFANLFSTLARVSARRIHGLGRNMARRMGMRLEEDLTAELRALERHGTRVHFVFSRSDPGFSMLREQAGSELRRLQRASAVTISFISGADHTFTPYPSQQELVQILSGIVTGLGTSGLC